MPVLSSAHLENTIAKIRGKLVHSEPFNLRRGGGAALSRKR